MRKAESQGASMQSTSQIEKNIQSGSSYHRPTISNPDKLNTNSHSYNSNGYRKHTNQTNLTSPKQR